MVPVDLLDAARCCLGRSAEPLFRSVSEGVVLTDTAPRILAVNPAFTRITGYSAQEAIGLNPRMLNSGQHPPEFYQHMWHALNAQGYWRGEIWNRRKTGEIYPELLTIQAIRNAQGEPENYLAIFSDLSQARREQELEEARRVAEEASRAKARFLANMSHEIRTPLTAIIGFAESMLDSHQTLNERAKAVDIIIRNGRHLQALLNDVLDLSKITAERIELEYLDTYLPDLLAGVVDVARMQIEGKDLQFSVHYMPPLPLSIRTDPTRARQVLINLVDNAIKFTDSGAVRLIVSFNPEQEQLSVAVQDTGIGISDERLAMLFEPFCQGDVSTTRRFGGTGLGLTIARELAERLGGTLQVTSSEGLGSLFVATLGTGPIAAEDLVWETCPFFGGESAARPHRVTRVQPLTGKVLVVDDNPDNQELISMYLRRCGLSLVIANHGQEAVEKAQQEPFDLVLMDMQMPVMDGLDATAWLRLTGFDKPILALSANVAQADRQAALEAGCDAYLGKPINLAEFFQVLGRYLPAGEASRPTALAGIEILDADPELQRLCADFIADLPRRRGLILAAWQSGDREALRVQAHQLKGVAANFGLPEITRVTGAIEFHLSRGDLVEVAALIEELETLWP